MRSVFTYIALLVMLVAGCQPATAPTSGTSSTGPAEPARAADQALRVGVNALPGSLSPESSTVYIYLFGALFDSLVKFDKDFNILPAAATKWEMLPDKSAWRFTLRDDLTFANGAKLTADDVEYTINTSIANRASQLAINAQVTGAKKVDDKTVDLLMSSPDVTVLINATDWFIFPKAYYTQVGKDGFATKPMGSGPYELTDYKPSDQVTFKLRSGYSHPFRKPIPSSINIKALPDSTVAVSGLRTGDIDILVGSYSTYTPDQAESAKAAGMALTTKLTSSSYILFDKSANEKSNSPLLDKRVRQAMNYAIDRETLAKTVFKGYAQPLGQIPLPGMPSFDDSQKPYPYDVAKAKALLAEAGYPNGFKLTGGLSFPASALNQASFLAMQDFHKQIGIEYPINSVEFVAFNDIIFVRNGRVRNEMQASGAQNTNGIVNWGILKCDQPLAYWCSPEYDKAMAQAYAEPDPVKRNNLFKVASKAWMDDAVAMVLVAQPQFTMNSPKIRGLDITTPVFFTFDSVYKVE